MFRKACLPDIRYKEREEFGQNIQKIEHKIQK